MEVGGLMKDVVVYVAGPYRCPEGHEWNVINNIRAAEYIALELWRHNIPTICPHKNTAFFGGACDDATWLLGDLIIIGRCDILVLVRGWENSIGTIAEIHKALDQKKPVFPNWRDAVNLIYKEKIYDTGRVEQVVRRSADSHERSLIIKR